MKIVTLVLLAACFVVSTAKAQLLMDTGAAMGVAGSAAGQSAATMKNQQKLMEEQAEKIKQQQQVQQAFCVANTLCAAGQQCTSADGKQCVCSMLPNDPSKRQFLYCR